MPTFAVGWADPRPEDSRGANAFGAGSRGLDMACPHLEFRESAGERTFDRARPFCTAAEAFVQPMRADICSERYGLEPSEHCEIYRDHERLG